MQPGCSGALKEEGWLKDAVPFPETLGDTQAWRGPMGLSRALGVGGGAHIISAEVLNGIGIVEDVPRQLLLLLSSLEDQAPFAEPDDVLLHQVQVHSFHELLGRQMPELVSHLLTPTPGGPSPPLN